MKKILALTLTVLFVFALTASAVGAFPEDMKVGQKVDESHPEGTITRVEFFTTDDGWQYIMPYRGDFGGDPYLDDGWIMNIITHEDYPGHVIIWTFVHETDPRYTGDNEIWGSWDQVLTIYGGQYYRDGSGKQ